MKIPAAATALLLLCTAAHAATVPTVVTTLPVSLSHATSRASYYTAVGDDVYFYAESASGWPGLWRWNATDGADLVINLATGRETAVTPIYMMAFGDKLLFGAHVDTRGNELWITDGTREGTTLIKDIDPASSFPIPVIVSAGKAYFTAYDRYAGRELWVTDGTEAGTTLVLDANDASTSSSPSGFAAANGLIVFSAMNELYATDGTPAGTTKLASGVSDGPLGFLNDRVYFLGSDATNGRELWSTDGTPAGTAMVKDINPGAVSSWGGISTPFAAHGGSLLFISEDATTGRELWKTDGTAAGTQLVKDVTPGAGSSQIDRLASSAAGGFFTVGDTVLWFTDGTEAGTIPVAEYARISSMVVGANGAYVVRSAGGTGVYALEFSDGSESGTGVVEGASPSFDSQLTATGSAVYFTGIQASSGTEPWVTDGTAAGTHILADVVTASGFANPSWMAAAGELVYFALQESLYRSDGTAAGTFPVGTAHAYYDNPRGAAFGSLFLYQGKSNDEAAGLWRTDGTVAGTQLVRAFNSIDEIVGTSQGYALVTARESSYGDYTVWRTDGTAAGTTQLLAVRGGSAFAEVAGRTYFIASAYYYSDYGDLWETQGTLATTRLVAKGRFHSLVKAGGLLYAVGSNESQGAEIWRSDGTGDGTSIIKDIIPGAPSSYPAIIGTLKNLVFFSAQTGPSVRELWRSDGTAAGTFFLKTLSGNNTYYNSPAVLEAEGNYFYFIDTDVLHGRELWRSDGTVAGTLLLTDVAGSTSLGLSFAEMDGKLLFRGRDARGDELWESDGTPAGTTLAADLIAGAASSYPTVLTTAAGHLFFITSADARLWAAARAESRLAVTDVRAHEGASSTIVFTVSRTGSTAGAASVQFATSDLTAVAGSDYQTSSGTLAFAAGETTKQIVVNLVDDTVAEQNESFGLSLTEPTGAVITRGYAAGIIEDDDRRVALSIELLPGQTGSYWYDTGRTFRITNSGPSGATVTLRVSESPYEGTFSCDNRNPSVCSVGYVPAGGFVDFRATRSDRNSARPGLGNGTPGRTLTASVSSLEAEEDLSDNTVARMITADARYVLPPFLVSGGSATAQVRPYSVPSSVRLALSGGIVVSPGVVSVTTASAVASFALSVAPNAYGWSTVTGNDVNSPLMRVPIVLPGETARLDTTILRPEYSTYFDHDEPVELPVTVAAVLHDGTRPSGAIRLFSAAGNTIIQEQVLDADGKATFTLTDVPIGSYTYKVAYAGDEFFHAATVDTAEVRVQGKVTSTTLTYLQRPCGETQLTATVTNPDGVTPTGSVNFGSYSSPFAVVPLTPTGTPGQAQATTSAGALSNYGTYIEVRYVPDPPFAASSDYEYIYSTTCPAPTLIASAATAASVSLIWSDVGADLYEIVRSTGPSPSVFTSVTTTAATTYVDSTVAPGKSYIYKVIAKTSGGVTRSTSPGDLATTILFTDDPIVFRATPVKATHIVQLRLAANAVRALAGQAPLTFGAIAAGSPIRATDITELRTAIGDALLAVGQGSVSWLETVAAGGRIKTIHVQQMRNVVK